MRLASLFSDRPQHLPLSGWTRKSLNNETGICQHSSHASLGTVGCQHATFSRNGVEPVENLPGPHFRLLVGRKSIKEDKIEAVLRIE